MRNIVVFLFAFTFCIKTISFAQAVDQGDSLVLVDLYNNMGGQFWERHENWLEQVPVKYWYGIVLTPDRIHVKYIDLQSNRLTKMIPTSIGNLSKCEKLDLQSNQIEGTIPESIGKLANLVTLRLNGNTLTGTIPASLGNLPKLESLTLKDNQLSGRIPENLGSNSKLYHVLLGHNKFTFDGMEELVHKNMSLLSYWPQDTIMQIYHPQGHSLVVDDRAVSANNVYNWYNSRNELQASIKGSPVFIPTKIGAYHVKISNSIATSLTLFSETEYPSVSVFDPYPDNVASDGSIPYRWSDFYYGKEISNASTDGITKLLLVTFSDNSDPVTFKFDAENSGLLSSREKPDVTSSQQITITPDFVNGLTVAVYTAPDGYGKGNVANRKVKVTATNKTGVIGESMIQLVTPPVVLVHGMWSDPSIWEKGGFNTFLRSFGILKTYAADYSKYSSSTFDPDNWEGILPRTLLQQKIQEAINDYRSQKIAVAQVDVVGHSLGGLMTRSLSQQNHFKTSSNYYKGYVHKLITLGTPHRGSPFGPELYNNRNKIFSLKVKGLNIPVRLTDIMSLLGNPIGSCHKDFGITSTGIQNLRQTLPYKTFAVTANYESGEGATTDYVGYTAMQAMCLIVFEKPFEQVMQSRCKTGVLPNDLIVPLRSQTGYINSTQLFYGTSHSVPGILTETKNPLMQKRITELLLSDEPTEFSSGFPAPSSFPLDNCSNASERIENHKASTNDKPTRGEKILDTLKGYVQLSSSIRGLTFQRNIDTTMMIGYQTFNGALPTNAILMIQDIGWYSLPTTPPYTLTISLPKDIEIGQKNIVLLVKDTTGVRFCDTSHISILPSGRLDTTIIEPFILNFDSTFRETKMIVHQTYSDSNGQYTKDMSSVLDGVSYTTLKNSSVIRVFDDGIVRAMDAGMDTLIVNVGDRLFKVPVFVDSNFIQRNLFPNKIDFEPILGKTETDGPFGLDAVATSGENVNFELIDGPVEIENGVVTIKGSGKVTIKATSAGNAYFDPAAPVTITFMIAVASPLPLQLLTFSGAVDTKDVLLTWSTVNEQNLSHFIAERSANGSDFTAIGKVYATGNSTDRKDYNFKDENVNLVAGSKVYYRLRIVDKDGKYEISNTVFLTINQDGDVVVYPNPSQRVITLLFNKVPEKDVQVKLLDMNGKLLMFKKAARLQRQEIYLPAVANGTYRMVIWSDGKIIHQQSIIVLN